MASTIWLELWLCLGLQCMLVAPIEMPSKRAWPPQSMLNLIDPKDGQINLAVRPKLTRTVENGKMAAETQLLLESLAGETESQSGSWLKRMVDLQWRMEMQHIPDFSLYPQVINLRQVVQDILFGQPVNVEPINDPPLKPLRVPKSACQQTSSDWPDLVIVVHTCATCTEARMHARDTFMRSDLWSEYNTRFVFVTMVTGDSSNMNASAHLNTTYPALVQESEMYEDLLIGTHPDQEWLETWAHILAVRWAAFYCTDKVPLFLFVNSDFSVNPRNVISFVRTIPRDLQSILNAGLEPKSLKVPRNTDLNAVSVDEIPWDIYPEHYDTRAFFLGSELMMQAAVATAFTKPFKQSSVYFGLIWWKLSYPVLKLPHIIAEQASNTTRLSLAVVKRQELDRYMDWASGFINPEIV